MSPAQDRSFSCKLTAHCRAAYALPCEQRLVAGRAVGWEQDRCSQISHASILISLLCLSRSLSRCAPLRTLCPVRCGRCGGGLLRRLCCLRAAAWLHREHDATRGRRFAFKLFQARQHICCWQHPVLAALRASTVSGLPRQRARLLPATGGPPFVIILPEEPAGNGGVCCWWVAEGFAAALR